MPEKYKSASQRKLDICKIMIGEGWVTAGRVGRGIGLSRTQTRKYLLQLVEEGVISISTSTNDNGVERTEYALYTSVESELIERYYGYEQHRSFNS